MSRHTSISGASQAGHNQVRLTAVLGPTNTGKTHFAMERMLAHELGMIGFPLRLLARENYDRAVALKGPHAVALVTGEEKIVPPHARYFLCTTEAMPLEREVEFVAIDEVQLGADPERGHVFTDRLLRARGRVETIVIGAETLRPVLRRILPEAEPVVRPRLSQLTYSGAKKLTRLPARSAIIGFSATEVYALAELMRRRRGGTAVVLGALSPRTRNAQVALYQSGDVDYIVATDAIGMGLNLDIDHVAFSRLSKFDGRVTRPLSAAEIGQIAGRAGRHMNDGTFGTTAGESLTPEIIESVEQHRFPPLRHLYWRNPELEFSRLDRLLASLSMAPVNPIFAAARDAEDALTLAALAAVPDIRKRAGSRDRLKLLWEVCQIPDFRKSMADTHSRLVGRIFLDITGSDGHVKSDWLARQVDRIDNTAGDIGTLIGRIAEIRTWTYVSYRGDWVESASEWQGRTRAVEDRLSDALHEKLTERFVDKRTAVLLRRLHTKDELMGGVRDDGEVVVEGVAVGKLEGFRFASSAIEPRDDARALRNAAERALRHGMVERVVNFEAAPDAAFSLADDGRILWNGVPIAALAKGQRALEPGVRPIVDSVLDPELRQRIQSRVQRWLDRLLNRRYGALPAPIPDALAGAARGIVYQLAEALGVVARPQVEDLVRSLDPAGRKALARLGVRLGTEAVYLARLCNAPGLRLAALLWALANDRAVETLPPLPATARSWWRAHSDWPEAFYRSLGYRLLRPLGAPAEGPIALRVDRYEAMAAAARRLARHGGFAATPALASAAELPLKIVPAALFALGYRCQPGESGGLYVARRANRAAERRAAEPAANPCSPFAQLRAMTGRSR